jgi:transposase
MSRRKQATLRTLTEEERTWLERISRSQSEPASHVGRAKEILAVAEGSSYVEAAVRSGRKSGDTVSLLVNRFNREGLKALQPGHGGGPTGKYGSVERARILREFQRTPDPAPDGTATWSLKTLCQALRQAPDGLPEVSEATIRTVLLEHGQSWQQSRSWCATGTAVRKRKRGTVTVTDPDTFPERYSSAVSHVPVGVWNTFPSANNAFWSLSMD